MYVYWEEEMGKFFSDTVEGGEAWDLTIKGRDRRRVWDV